MIETLSRVQQIPLAQPSITEAEIAAVLNVLRTPVLSMGPQVTAFEQELAAYVGVAHGIAVNSGTSGLHLCLAARGIGPGDEVITSPFSFVASANCALYQGATPVFADIDAATLTIDPAQVAAKMTAHTKALLPVDVFGQPAPIDDLLTIGAQHGVPVIRDSCEAIGAERHGVRVGRQGLASVFAFYPNKQMTTGEGGMIVTADPAYARVLRSLCNQGRDDAGTWMTHVRLGYNYRLDELSAALGRVQLSRLDTMLAQTRPGGGLVRRALAPYRWHPRPLHRARHDPDELVCLCHPPGSGNRPCRADDAVGGGRDSEPALLRADSPAALLPRPLWLPTRGFPGDRAGGPVHPGAPLLHRDARRPGRLRVRAVRRACDVTE